MRFNGKNFLKMYHFLRYSTERAVRFWSIPIDIRKQDERSPSFDKELKDRKIPSMHEICHILLLTI